MTRVTDEPFDTGPAAKWTGRGEKLVKERIKRKLKRATTATLANNGWRKGKSEKTRTRERERGKKQKFRLKYGRSKKKGEDTLRL